MPVEPDYEQEAKDAIAGRRINEFLTDTHVKAAIDDKAQEYFTKWRRAKSAEEATALWYLVQGMDAALFALKVTTDKAEVVERNRAERDRVASRPTPRSR